MIGIYKIYNNFNSKIYIGSSNNIKKRILSHFRDLKVNNHRNGYLQNAYNKYGKDYFKYEILEILPNYTTKEELLKIEQEYIDKYDFDLLYNLNPITNSGGAETLKISSYLLNLKGEILKEFDSLIAISKYLNCSQINKNRYNNSKILFKKYRVVTKEFYENNLDLILSWKVNYHKKDDYLNYYKFDEISRKYIVFDGDDIIARTEDENLAIKISKIYVESINE